MTKTARLCGKLLGVKNFDDLFKQLAARIQEGDESSATVAAIAKGEHFIGKKIIEEAGEVWIAAEYQSDDELAEEMSQLIYWLQVMMHKRGLKPEDIYKYL